MSYYETTNTFNYNFNQVASTFWNRYPNPSSTHVLTEDTISRKVENGKLYTRRLLSKTNVVPKWGERFFSAKSVKILEDSEVDPKQRTLRTYTRNIGFKKIMSVVETVDYFEENGNTVAKRSAFITSTVFGFSRAIRAFGIERFKSNCNKAANGFNYILANRFPNQLKSLELSTQQQQQYAITAIQSENKPAKMERLKNTAKSVYKFSKSQALKLTQLFSVKN